jgi:hypothetical protein
MLAEANLVGQSCDILAESGERYGAPRMRAELRDRGIPIASKRVARLMRLMQITPNVHSESLEEPLVNHLKL